MTSVDAANRPRYAGRPGYDAWYLTFSDSGQGIGVWIRWTALTFHSGIAGQAHSASWAFILHRGRPGLHAGVRQFHPYEPSFRDLGAGEITSGGRSARWKLTLESRAAPFAYAGRLVERLLPNGNAMAHPRLSVTGTFELDGQHYAFDRVPGGQGHTWGASHLASWNWVHAALPNGWLTGASTPIASPYGVQLGRQGRSRTGIAAVLARGAIEPGRWAAEDIEVTVHPDDCIGVEYQDPAGGRRICYHSEFGRLTVAGDVVSSAAAFEYASPDPLPGRSPIEL